MVSLTFLLSFIFSWMILSCFIKKILDPSILDIPEQNDYPSSRNNDTIKPEMADLSQLHDSQTQNDEIATQSSFFLSQADPSIEKLGNPRKRKRQKKSQNCASVEKLREKFEEKLETSIEDGQCSTCKKQVRTLEGYKSHIINKHGFEALNVKPENSTQETRKSQRMSK